MKERPILFNGAMVRAILEGRKTQTRRIWKMPRGLDWYVSGCMRGEETGDIHDPKSNWWGHVEEMACPYGRPGERLWVRETWGYNPDFPGIHGRACYRADPGHEYDGIKWKPSIHMPRAACRLMLEITAVRVERLNDCSEEDALAEGVFKAGPSGKLPIGQCVERVTDGIEVVYIRRGMALDEYRELWNSINGAGAWEANPWVWVVEFRRNGGQA